MYFKYSICVLLYNIILALFYSYDADIKASK